MASYELDFGDNSGWSRHLGRHRLAAFAEETEEIGSLAHMRVFNTTPFATSGGAARINSGPNLMNFRYYFDPAAGKVGVGEGPYDTYKDYVYADSPLPEADPSGVTPAYIAITGNARESTLSTYGLSSQSFFLNDRLVLTNGVRKDESELWQANSQDLAALRDANNIRPDPALIDPSADYPDSLGAAGGYTYTHGAVAHVFPWMSLTFNWSENFNPNTSSYNIYGRKISILTPVVIISMANYSPTRKGREATMACD
jgi:hypothetical protein